jgi:DNA (cytosine-5)-methyltransferase 1
MDCIEVCTGAGGEALGLEQAGFRHKVLVELDHNACNTIRINRPLWNVLECDIAEFNANEFMNIDLIAGGLPCPPFSVAGKQLGPNDERNLFPEMIRLVNECHPKAIMIENVRGLLDKVFDDYRSFINKQIETLGYKLEWRLLNASDYGVPQLRPRILLVALKEEYFRYFNWPEPVINSKTVGDVLYKEMASRGWKEVNLWRERAKTIAPTIVGGSKKHGGPDLGPSRARKAWAKLGVDGYGIAEEPPGPDFEGMPRLTVKMAALIQGFPEEWIITGKRTPAYRQVGNAFPPQVSKAVGTSIAEAIEAYESSLTRRQSYGEA